MNISKYEDYFHDGTIHDIDHNMNNIILSLESAQLQSDWNKDNIQLSKNKTISGKLHIEEVKAIRINNKVFDDCLKKTYDSSDIYDLSIQKNKVRILVSWIDYPPKPPVETDVFTIEIEADNIFWENVPHLFESSWEA